MNGPGRRLSAFVDMLRYQFRTMVQAAIIDWRPCVAPM